MEIYHASTCHAFCFDQHICLNIGSETGETLHQQYCSLHGHVLQEQNMNSGSDYDARILSDEMLPKSRNDIFWSAVATHTIKWSVRMHIIILSALGEAQVDAAELIRQGRELGKANASCEVAGCVAWSPLCIE